MGWQDGSVVGDVGNLQRFLDFLGKAEGADYGTIVGGGKFDDFSKHPGVVGLRTKEGPSTAAGKYQITQTTYNDVAQRLGIKDFSPESQDAIATELIRRRGAFDDVVSGDFKTAVAKLGSEWASLPSSPYSQPKKDWAFVEKNLTQDKAPAWMSDPVVEEGAPKQSAQPAWMLDPVVDDEVPPEAPKAPQATTPAPTPQKAPVEAPRGLPAASFTDNALRGLSFGTRDVLEGVEKAFTYPVRAVGEFASGALRLAGQREMADKVSQTVGMQNKGAGAVVADAVGLDKAETKAEKTASAFTQAAAGLVPGTALARLTQKAPEAVRSAASILTPSTGGSAANVAKDVAVFGGLGAGFEMAPAETSAGLAALAGGAALAGKAVKGRGVNKFIEKAGSADDAALNAEIYQRARQEFYNPARNAQGSVGPLQAEELNQRVIKSFLQEAKSAVSQLPKNAPERGPLLDAISRGANISTAEVDAIRSLRGGDDVADVLFKAQRARALLAAVPAQGGILGTIVREAIDRAPAAIMTGSTFGVPIPLKMGVTGVAQKVLGRQTREQVGEAAVSTASKYADEVLAKTGPSRSSQALERLKGIGAEAQATQAVQKAEEAAANLAKEAAKKQGVLEKARAESAKRYGSASESLDSKVSDVLQGRKALESLEDARAASATKYGTASKTPQTFAPSGLSEAEKAAARAESMQKFGSAAKASQKVKASVAQVTAQRNQQHIEDGIAAIREGRLIGDLSRQGGPFRTTVSLFDASEDDMFKAIQKIAQDDPKMAGDIVQMFTPGGYAPNLYTIQNRLMDQGIKRREGVHGALAAATQGGYKNLDAAGDVIRSNRLYDEGIAARQLSYKQATTGVDSVAGVSEGAKKAVKAAIEDLRTGSPSNPEATLKAVEKRLTKLTAEERTKLGTFVDDLIARFYDQ